MSDRLRRHRRLLFFALFLTFDLIMFGAFVRVTDAGLGCPDWPGCYGKATPLGALAEIRAEASARPQGPVTEFKAWVEMLHRYVAAALGLAIIWLAVQATRLRAEAVTRPALAWFTVFWVVLQGMFGMWTVTLRLQPAVVTAHLLGGMILFALLLAMAVRVAPQPPLSPQATRYRGWIAAALVLLFVQIALGGWVSTNYATLACREFPDCQGSLWPPMDFARGFEIWRDLGYTGGGEALPFAALTAIHYTHRLFAYVVFAVVGLLAWRLRDVDGMRGPAAWLGAVLALQLLTGLTNIFLDWPLVAAVAHTGGATALLGLLLMLKFRAFAASRASARVTPPQARAAVEAQPRVTTGRAAPSTGARPAQRPGA